MLVTLLNLHMEASGLSCLRSIEVEGPRTVAELALAAQRSVEERFGDILTPGSRVSWRIHALDCPDGTCLGCGMSDFGKGQRCRHTFYPAAA
jgi:hypothetical protein